VERTIQTLKQTLKKALKAEDDVHLALLALKTTPLTDSHSSLTDHRAHCYQYSKMKVHQAIKNRSKQSKHQILLIVLFLY